MVENNEFMIDPNSFDTEDRAMVHVPPNAEAAWMLELIRVRLSESPISEDFKRELIDYMTPYLNLAGLTNISRGQVIEFWMGYQKIWTKYRIYMNRDKFNAKLIFLKDWILEMFMMMLNKSIDGWQGDRIFERRYKYEMKQKREERSDRVRNWFKPKHKEHEVEE